MLSKFHKEDDKAAQKVEKQFIVFIIGEEQFGVNVKQAKEIINDQELTIIPNAPDFVKGVINLRGDIIPIIDLRKRLNLKTEVSSDDKKIIVVELDNTLIGMQVDDVKEMIRLYEDDIAEPPKIVRGINRDYLSGVGKLEDKLLILLDLDMVLSEEELNEINNMDTN